MLGADLQFANLERARGIERVPGLKGIGRSGAQNIILAHYSPDILSELNLPSDHNQRLDKQDLSKYKYSGMNFSAAKLAGFDLSGATLTDCLFVRADLSGATLTGADLSWSTLEGANLTRCSMRKAILTYCNLRNCCMHLADLKHADIRISDLEFTDLQKADLREVIFFWRTSEPDMFRSKNYVFAYCSSNLANALNLRPATGRVHRTASVSPVSNNESEETAGTNCSSDSPHNEMLNGKSLARYDLTGRNFDGLDLSGWDLSGAICERTSFIKANLCDCKLNGAILDQAQLDGAQLRSATLDNASLQRASIQHADLAGAKLAGANLDAAMLDGTNFANANLSGAKLSRARAIGSRFSGADLSCSDLTGANLQGANLTEAKLDSANLTDTVLVSAKLVRTRLVRITATGANFGGVEWEHADIQRANFCGSVGLTRLAIGRTCNSRLAKFDEQFLDELGFPEPKLHNGRIDSGDFSYVNFSKCDITGADLKGTILNGAIFTGATLDGACLEDVEMIKAVLDGASLKRANLQSANLTLASLRGACLDGSRAERAILVNTDLRMASLRAVSLKNSNVTGTLLRDAILEGADMEEVQGLYCDQLAATNINNTKLPPGLGEFTALRNIEGITISARGLVLTMVLLCAYSAIQVASLRDGDMLSNRSILSSSLLDIRTLVLFFCFGGPLILVAVYLWAHFYLQHLWEELAQLPAIFNDSRPLYKRVYPWFLNTFVSAHFPILRKDRPLLTHVQIVASVAITWWMVPATLFILWARYLSCHDMVGTGVQVIVLSVSITLATLLQSLAGATLRGETRKPMRLYRPTAAQMKISALMLAVVAGLSLFSLGAIEGCPVGRNTVGWLGRQVWRVGCEVFVAADLTGAEVSTKTSGWRGDEEALVSGAKLAWRDLQHARGSQAFLAKADLRHADLRGADFTKADLRWADLSEAHLEQAHLVGADLRGANFHRANMAGTDLRGARLVGAVGLTKEQLKVAIVDSSP